MSYSKKLEAFFKSKGISQKEAAEKLSVSPTMMSRYLRGDAEFSGSFIVRLIATYPDMDLQYIFTDGEPGAVAEPSASYPAAVSVIDELSSIQQRIELIKKKIELEV